MREKRPPSLSVIIPAYNEEETLALVLDDCLAQLPRLVSDYEIIVVNNGSLDKTGQIADSYAKKNKHIRVVNVAANRGLNKGMIAGIRAARKDYAAYVQADGQIKIKNMAKCIKIMGGYDLVLGIRGKRLDYSYYRLMLSYGCLLLYRLLFNLTYEDVHWVYIWKTKEVQKLKLDLNGGVFLLAESLIKFRRKGLRVGEASCPYRPRIGGKAKSIKFDSIARTLVSIFRLKWQILTGKV